VAEYYQSIIIEGNLVTKWGKDCILGVEITYFCAGGKENGAESEFKDGAYGFRGLGGLWALTARVAPDIILSPKVRSSICRRKGMTDGT